jgi:hypothetical protein
LFEIEVSEVLESQKGYDLGKKVKEDECKRICQEWNKLEKQVLPLQGKKDSQKTNEERKLEHDYEIFWEHKTLKKTNEKEVSHRLAVGFKKAILEKCK